MSDPTALVAELRAVLTDWNGADIPDAELPRVDVLCGTLRRAAALIAQQAATIEDEKALRRSAEGVGRGYLRQWEAAEAALTAAEAERDRLVAEEREACARVVEDMPVQIYRDLGIGPAGMSCKPATFDDAAAAIRGRSRGASKPGVPYRPRNSAEAEKDLRHDQPDRLRPHPHRLPHAADEALTASDRAALSTAKERGE